ncbi:MAG: hypothetical protein JO323_02190 [Acidobacteriia bacterium]|nr:hypothetical protein [Terriglobia bacterium]
MFLFDFFRSLLPLHNPIGFGASDFVSVTFALVLAAAAIAWPRVALWTERFAARTGWCMLALAILPIILRLALLPNHPVPTADIYDEFGHLLEADTLRHFRLANPPHALPQFFETQFVLEQPTYSSIYPLGQALALAAGWSLTGHPWAGVLLAVGAFCGLCYWMLRAWTTPGWALAGGLLAVAEFGPLNYWMNSYWGGGLAAAAGCLVFGALPRLARTAPAGAPGWGRSWKYAAALGTGLGLHLLIRPFESIFLLLSVLLFFAPNVRRPKWFRAYWRLLPAAALPVAAALALMLLQNRAVTGNWTTLPYQLSRYQYGVPAALVYQTNPFPHRQLNREQALNYQMQKGFHGNSPETWRSFGERLEYRVRFYRFFFLAPLYLVLPLFLWRARTYWWVLLSLASFGLGANLYPNFETHYIAAATCLFVLAAVIGLEQLARISPEASRILGFLCLAQFLFWYTMHLFDNQPFSMAARQFETWDGLNHRNPAARIEVNRRLAMLPGQLLVFVRYYPQHPFQQEWVYNAADIDGSRIVWARDLGPEEDAQLRAYYPNRSVWLLEPDYRPPRLTHLAP